LRVQDTLKAEGHRASFILQNEKQNGEVVEIHSLNKTQKFIEDLIVTKQKIKPIYIHKMLGKNIANNAYLSLQMWLQL
jgi:hypothetical protein